MIASPLFKKAALVVWLVSVAGTIYVSLLPRLALPLDFWNADKLYHAVTYAWLGGLPLWIFSGRERARGAAYAMILLGCLLEWGQSYVPGRSASIGDAVANTLGVFCGIWLSEMLLARVGGRHAPGR